MLVINRHDQSECSVYVVKGRASKDDNRRCSILSSTRYNNVINPCTLLLLVTIDLFKPGSHPHNTDNSNRKLIPSIKTCKKKCPLQQIQKNSGIDV